jgi:S-formylglutathione hydrolase
MQRIEQRLCFGGSQEVWQHASTSLRCTMKFAVYLPPQSAVGPLPVVYWLSGLTCTEQNFITKSGVQMWAAKHGVAVVAPDTSPRGDDVANDPSYDLGQGASFYVNATQAPWAAHFQMHDYVVHELPALVQAHFGTRADKSIMGHSMGGHGALVLALRNPGAYRSVSAIAPIVAPSRVPWGQRALRAYLGGDEDGWQAWDACSLVSASTQRLPLLVDQGTADEFVHTQLKPELFVHACKGAGYPLTLRMHDGYDHSYYFISSVMEDHVKHHAAALHAQPGRAP